MTKNKRSPLKDRPLRNPGQSLDEEINRIIDEDISSYIFLAVFFVVITGLEWWRAYAELPPSPIIFTFAALVAILYSTIKIINYKKRLKKLRLGRDGERAVGQYLELLRDKGYRIFHDLIGEGFNVDHVIVCEHGVFTVETKSYSKPESGDPKIVFNGSEIIVDGFNTNTGIVIQATSQADWLQNIIKESTGKDISVKPVVVFPGWYIQSNNSKTSNVWVLNPKALPTYIGNSPKILKTDEMMMVCYHLSRFIRSSHE